MSRLEFLDRVIPMINEIIRKADADYEELNDFSHNAKHSRQARAWREKAQAKKDLATAMTRLQLDLIAERKAWRANPPVPETLVKPYSRKVY